MSGATSLPLACSSSGTRSTARIHLHHRTMEEHVEGSEEVVFDLGWDHFPDRARTIDGDRVPGIGEEPTPRRTASAGNLSSVDS